MRVNCSLVMFFIVLLQAHAFPVLSQETITIKEKNASLEKVLEDIRRQTGMSYTSQDKYLSAAHPVTVEFKDAPLADVLRVVFKDQPVTYEIIGRLIVVRPKVPEAVQDNQPPTDGSVRGKIVDSVGNGLQGASIQVRGSRIGGQTRSDGTFELKGVKPTDILLVSFTGFLKKEVPVDGRSFIAIALVASTSPLDEVHIVAYGTTTSRENVGSIAKISSDVIDQQPVSNPLAAMEGRVPGVFIQTQNGLPGGNISVQIRGQNSITAGLDPLYIVDGIPFSSSPLNYGPHLNSNFDVINGPVSPLNSIPPGEIESIEVLKDADATAVYGSRGSNGVVIITTKRGKAGKTKFDISVSQGANSLSRFAHFLSLKDYLALSREGYANDSTTPSSDPNSSAYAPFLTVWDTTKSTDWQRFLLGGIDHVTQVNAAVSGGNENTRFVVGGNFRKEGSILPGDCNYNRYGVFANIDHNYKRFHALFSMSYTADKNDLLASSVAMTAVVLAPDYPAYNSDGTLNWYDNNPIAWLKQKSDNATSNIVIDGVFRYDLLSNLHLKANVGYTKINSDFVVTNPASSQNPAYGVPSTADFGSNFNQTFLAEPQLEYTPRVGNRGRITFLAGSSYQETLNKGWTVEGTNYTNEAFLSQLSYAGAISKYANNYTQYKYFSVFAKGSFVWDERYILSLTGRRDGSSKFGPDDEYGNFGSVGAGWVFTEEPFFKSHFTAFDFGKIRASYGITGNDQITPYQYIATYGSSFSTYQGQSVLAPATVANGRYGWERNKKLNLGIDLGFYKDRLYVTGDVFLNRCDNLLVQYPLPYTSGPFGSYQANLPAKIENRGFELSLTTVNIVKKNFEWRSGLNFTASKNELVAFPNINQTAYANTYTVGKDLSVIKGYKSLGVDPQSGVTQFLDVNKDGVISYPQDIVDIGKASPDYFGGLMNSIKLYGFQLSIFFQFVGQHSLTNSSALTTPILDLNTYSNTLARWQKPGDRSNIQRATEGGNGAAVTAYQTLPQSSAAIINSSYCRLKNLSLSYNLPGGLLKRIGVQGVRVYFEGQDLFVITKDKNIDPETVSQGPYTVPVIKSIVGGIQITL